MQEGLLFLTSAVLLGFGIEYIIRRNLWLQIAKWVLYLIETLMILVILVYLFLVPISSIYKVASGYFGGSVNYKIGNRILINKVKIYIKFNFASKFTSKCMKEDIESLIYLNNKFTVFILT